MNQAGRVQQLQRNGGTQGRIVNAAQPLGHEQHQHGAHHLSVARADVFEYAVKQRVGVRKGLVKEPAILFQLRGYGLSDI